MELRTLHKWGKCSTYQDTHFNNHPMCSRVSEPWSTSNLGSPPLSHALWDSLVSPAFIHKHPHPGGTLIRSVSHTVIWLEQRVGAQHRFQLTDSALVLQVPLLFQLVFFFKIYFILHVCGMCVCCTCVCVWHMYVGVLESQKSLLDPLELDLR